MTDFRLTEKDFEEYVSKSQHGGRHLWDLLVPRLEEVYEIPFNVQGFNRVDYLEKLWLWPNPMRARWYQTRLVFHRPNDEGCYVGLGLEKATDETLAEKGVVDPDWPRLVQAVRNEKGFRQAVETLFQQGYEAYLQPWEKEDEPPHVVHSLSEFERALAETSPDEELNFYLVHWLPREDVLNADDQIELLMSHYRDVKPVFKRLVPEWLEEGRIASNAIMDSPTREITKSIADLLNHKSQVVLQGAPGTGKTHTALLVTASQLGVESSSHQELRQALHHHQLARLLDADPNLSEAPAAIANQVRELGHGLWEIVQFHPGYSYEDFVRGLVAEPTADGHNISFRAVNRIFGLLAAVAVDLAEDENPLPVVLIIDEINRGDLSKVLGELIYALEYRDETVLTPYSVDGHVGLTLPAKNLYLIGTMNTADRSIALVDYAIRRRFAFVQLNPSREVIESYHGGNPLGHKALALFDKMQQLFDSQLNPVYNREDMAVGHTYFLAEEPKKLIAEMAFGIVPLLREYLREGILNGDPVLDLDGQRVNLSQVDQFELMEVLKDWVDADG